MRSSSRGWLPKKKFSSLLPSPWSSLRSANTRGASARVVAGLDHALHPLPVRLALEVTPEAVDGRDEGELEAEPEEDVRRGPQHLGRDVVALALLAAGRDRDPERGGDGEGGEPDLLVLRVAVEHERVAVRDVRQLVAEDHGQLRFVLDTAQEPGVDVDLAVRHGEGIERRVAEDGDAGGGRARLLGFLGDELGRHGGQVVLQQRVVVGLAELGELLLFLLGVAPELPLVWLGAEGSCPDSPWAGRWSRRIRTGGPRPGSRPKTLWATPTGCTMTARRY